VFIGPCGTVLQDAKECVQSKEEQNRLVIKNLEEENERLRTRCTDLLNDLEKLRNQEAHWRKEKHSVDTRVKVQGGPVSMSCPGPSFLQQPNIRFSLNNKLSIQIHQ
jgi:hypothetical protein